MEKIKMILGWIWGIALISFCLFMVLQESTMPLFRGIFLVTALGMLFKLIQLTFLKEQKVENKEEIMRKWAEGNRDNCPSCNAPINEDMFRCKKCGNVIPNEELEKAEKEILR